MTSMNISIKQEAYDFLKSLKTKENSFSDVILSFKKEKDFMRFFGSIPRLNYNDDVKKAFNKRLE